MEPTRKPKIIVLIVLCLYLGWLLCELAHVTILPPYGVPAEPIVIEAHRTAPPRCTPVATTETERGTIVWESCDGVIAGVFVAGE